MFVGGGEDRDYRENRDYRDYRDYRENRENREIREIRDVCVSILESAVFVQKELIRMPYPNNRQ